MFHSLYLLSWNPLIDGLVGGGLFAIIGAFIGGHLALRAQREQRAEEIRGAIRAVAAEVMKNSTMLSAILQGLRGATWTVGKFNMTFAHEAFDNYLAQASLRLSLDQVFILVGTYIGLSGVEYRLERTVREFNGQRPPDPVVTELLHIFAPVAQSSEEAIRMLQNLEVWTDQERHWISDALRALKEGFGEAGRK